MIHCWCWKVNRQDVNWLSSIDEVCRSRLLQAAPCLLALHQRGLPAIIASLPLVLEQSRTLAAPPGHGLFGGYPHISRLLRNVEAGHHPSRGLRCILLLFTTFNDFSFFPPHHSLTFLSLSSLASDLLSNLAETCSCLVSVAIRRLLLPSSGPTSIQQLLHRSLEKTGV